MADEPTRDEVAPVAVLRLAINELLKVISRTRDPRLSYEAATMLLEQSMKIQAMFGIDVDKVLAQAFAYYNQTRERLGLPIEHNVCEINMGHVDEHNVAPMVREMIDNGIDVGLIGPGAANVGNAPKTEAEQIEELTRMFNAEPPQKGGA